MHQMTRGLPFAWFLITGASTRLALSLLSIAVNSGLMLTSYIPGGKLVFEKAFKVYFYLGNMKCHFPPVIHFIFSIIEVGDILCNLSF